MRIEECGRITEWINPYDPRLEHATGEPAPNSGGMLREEWSLDEAYSGKLEAVVQRLIVPGHIALLGEVQAAVDYERSAVVLDFTKDDDWLNCFPAGQETTVSRNSHGAAWAAVALCGTKLGLAVFSRAKEEGVRARIQPVPDDIFGKIIGE